MSNPGKAPSLEALGYDYWKTRMKVYLLSQGSDIWSITQDATYIIPAERTEALAIAKFERNSKVVNRLFVGLGTKEFKRVCPHETAREIWAKLKEHHEGTDTIKACLF